MPGRLPPAPIGEPPNSYAWQEWYSRLRELYTGPGAIPWEAVSKTGANITDIPTRAHNTLQSIQGGIAGEHFHLSSTQHTTVSNLVGSTYTPTLTAVSNVDSATAYVCQYLRVGSVVHVSGKLDVDPTISGAATILGISLPIASNFDNEQQCTGVANQFNVVSANGIIRGDTTNDRAELYFISTGIGVLTFFFTFTYFIL